MSGYYLMHRDWQDNPLFGREAFSRRDAWIWLIERASFSSKSVSISGKTVHLQRGQLSSSLRYMAKAWGWDEAKVRRFLSRAKSESMIDAATDAGQTVITICNYDRYQTFNSDVDAPSDAETTQERRSTDAKYKEGKKGKEDTSEAKASSVARARSHPFPCPAGVDPQHWADFRAARRKKRCTDSLSAYTAILKDLATFATGGWPPGRLVQRSAEKGWASIVNPNEHHQDNRNGTQQHRGANDRAGAGQRVDGFTAALREVSNRGP